MRVLSLITPFILTTMVKRILLIALFAVAYSLPSMAQVEEATFKNAFMGSYDAANGKIVQLAMAFTEDQYDWRPSEGVRSVKEALMHIANANVAFAGMLGGEVPESLKGRNLEKDVTSKEDAIKVLKESIAASQKAVKDLNAAAMSEKVDWFDGSKMPKLNLVMVVNDHAQEHLGQLIAYARSQDVTPPWSN